MESATDAYCIEKILDGRTEYFSVLMDRYSRPVFSLIVKMTANRQDAEELTQDVFLKAFRSLSTFRGNSSFATWLYRIACNTAISAMRKQTAEWRSFADISEAAAEEDPEDAVAELNAEMQLERLQKALQRIPPDDKALILMFYMQEKTITEIAAIMRLNPPNVKTKLHRARKKLLVLMTNDI